MKFKPHDYQNYIIEKMKNSQKLMAVVDMGLGKTICALSAIDYLIYSSFEVNKVLVIAPLRVARSVWPDEIKKWDHTSHLTYVVAVGPAKERERAVFKKVDMVIINRENVEWLISMILDRKQAWPFDMIVIDESSSFKTHSTKRFKALKKATVITSRIIELTGTPAPNGLLDLWAQIYLLDSGSRLGKTITTYRNRYFIPDKRNATTIFSYALRYGADKEIYKQVDDISISLRAKDYIKLPTRTDNIIRLNLEPDAAKAYLVMERDCVLKLRDAERNGDATVIAMNKAALLSKLLQISNGAVYNDFSMPCGVSWVHDTKLDALEEIIELNEGKPVLVYYTFLHDKDRILKRFEKLNPRVLDTTDDINAWNAGKIRLLVAHPASAGHGLNLQAGGNIIVWFGLTWSLELFQQANARLYRQGQEQAVIIHYLVIADSVDEDVMAALQKKTVSQDALIDAVKARWQNVE